MDKKNFEKNYSIQSVHRVIQIIRAFTRENKKLRLTELHSITGISKSSLQRLLSTLTVEGLLIRNEDKRYQLGLEFLFIGELVELNNSLITLAKPIMETLKEDINESVSLSVIENDMRKCIYNIESSYELAALTFAGQTSPLYAGASAKALLANFSETEFNKYLNRISLEKITETTIFDHEELKEELQKVRDNGYALSYGERVKGAVSVSAPIFDPSSKVIASLSTVIPTVRVEDYQIEQLIYKIQTAANEITKKLRAK